MFLNKSLRVKKKQRGGGGLVVLNLHRSRGRQIKTIAASRPPPNPPGIYVSRSITGFRTQPAASGSILHEIGMSYKGGEVVGKGVHKQVTSAKSHRQPLHIPPPSISLVLDDNVAVFFLHHTPFNLHGAKARTEGIKKRYNESKADSSCQCHCVIQGTTDGGS